MNPRSVFGMEEAEIGWYVPHSFSGASQTTVVDPLNKVVRLIVYKRADRLYQLFPTRVMGEQPKPMGTLRPLRSRPRPAATAETALLEEDWTLSQHWGEVGVVTGGGGFPRDWRQQGSTNKISQHHCA
jgi:hypothetical protein